MTELTDIVSRNTIPFARGSLPNCVINTLLPVYAQEQVVKVITGLPKGKLRELAKSGAIRAHKNANELRGVVLYNIQDCIAAVESMPLVSNQRNAK